MAEPGASQLPDDGNAPPPARGNDYAAYAALCRHRRLLFLQGPNGPFFARLRDRMEGEDRTVWKVNFNAGDDLFYRRGRVIRFTRPMPQWEGELRALLAEHRIDAIVVFGSHRRQHRIAARVARTLGIAFWVFEEGYVRPGYVTLETGGVNAESPLAPLLLAAIPDTPLPPPRRAFPHAFRRMAWQSLCYFTAGLAGARRYPHYRHHKPFGLYELGAWLRAGWRKPVYRRQERALVRWLLAEDHPPFFLVALQVHNDSQIRVNSPWRRNEDFIEWTMFSFARHAPADAVLVIKHHPMERGHKDYAEAISAFAQRFGLGSRVVYLHDAHLPSLLQRCDGLVTINSTTGLQALYHRTPVIALGRCFYAKAGLTWQGPLDDFWRHPAPVDMHAFRRFRRYLIHASQINGSFYADRHPGEAAPRTSRGWAMRAASLAGVALVWLAREESGALRMLGRLSQWVGW